MKILEKTTIHGKAPSKSNCYRIATRGKHASLYKTKALQAYEEKFFIQIPPKYRGLDITGYFKIEVDVFYPTERADLDNSLKCTLDCLQKAKVIRNDRRCVEILARKALDKDNPRIEFVITEL